MEAHDETCISYPCLNDEKNVSVTRNQFKHP